MGIRSGFRKVAVIGLYCAGIALAQAHNAQAENNAKFAVGPDSNYTLLINTLKSAKSQILINIYEFDQAPIAALMIDKIREGVELRVLIETQPCCNNKMTEDAKKIIRSLHAEMTKAGMNPNSRIYLMGANVNPKTSPSQPGTTPAPAPAAQRRYRYNHAKYAVIDGSHVMISSENLTESGHPLPGYVGNRGYTADLVDANLVQSLTNTFAGDTDSKNTDVLGVGPTDVLPLWMGDKSDILQNETTAWEVLEKSQTSTQVPGPASKKRKNKAILGSEGFASKVDFFSSPKSLPGLEEFVSRVVDTLKIQFMSMPATWGSGSRTIVNPIVARAIRAASNGVSVRFLLNDERTFDPQPNPTKAKGNEITVAYLDKLAECYRLPIKSKIIDVDATGITYIHNKGMIADAKHVLISSINGTQNSVENNRETAVSVSSEDMGAYYTVAHDYDWTQTTQAFSDSRVAVARALYPNCPALPLASEDGSVDPVFRTPGFGIVKFY